MDGMMKLLTIDDIRNSVDEIISSIKSIIPSEINRILVSEWAEKHRLLPDGLSPYPGPYSFDVCPYMREIVDCLSEQSSVREVAVMKGTQIMFTVGTIENWIGYTIDSSPAPMLYVTGDATLADTQMELRVDAMINNSGLGNKIGSQFRRTNQRKTGDIKSRKEFPGGFLMSAGPNSGAKLRAMSYKKICVDEIDSFKDSTGKEGDPIYLIRRRTDAFSEMYTILWGSTPLFAHNSKIKPLFLEGDQRKYFVPCRLCGHKQFLRWGAKETPGGLKFEHDEDDRLVYHKYRNGKVKESSVYYECEKCRGKWKNSDKDWFLPRGEWIPTAEPRRPDMRSYHIPGLLSPVGFRSWESGVIEFLQIKHEGFPKLKFQNWINTFLGEPFEDRGEKPRIEILLTRERTYHSGTLPGDAKVLFITIGADVQKDRIECEIVGWGKDKESWSIDYHGIHGDTSKIEDPCWEVLRNLIQMEHAGKQAILSGIDSGYQTNVVYQFCDSFDSGVHPVMGVDDLSKGKEYIKLFPIAGRKQPRVHINTDLLKQEIYQYLNKGKYESGGYPPGYCHFPVEYTREHFNRLTAEQRVIEVGKNGKTSFKWDAGARRNEQLDCRVYAMAMVYGYRQYVEEVIRESNNIAEDESLTWEDFWDYLQ